MSTIVQAKYLPMVAPFISTEETRYYLKGVYIEPHHEKGALLVATDGHRMGVIHDADAECDKAAIWPLDSYLIKWLTEWQEHAISYEDDDEGEVTRERRNLTGLVARFDGRHVDIIRPGENGRKDEVEFSAASEAIDGKYPDWRKPLPKPEQLGPTMLGFNPEYIGALKAIGGSVEFHTCAASADGNFTPAIIRCSEVPEFFGLLMPIKRESGMEPFPDWLNPKQGAAA